MKAEEDAGEEAAQPQGPPSSLQEQQTEVLRAVAAQLGVLQALLDSTAQQPWDCDLTTVARGPDECNALIRRGWRIFQTFGVDEVRVRSRPAVQERRQVMVYYVMGRKFGSAEGEQERAALQVEASEAADAAAVPPPEAEEPDAGSGQDKPAPATAEPRPLIARRKKPKRKAGAARRGKAHAPGALGDLATEGIR